MNTNDQRHLSLGASLWALSVGLCSCLTIGFILVALGLPALEAFVFAFLGSFIITCFVWIERKLSFQIAEKDRIIASEVSYRMDSQNRVYSRSLACMVRFDIGNFIIDRVSPGFIKMLTLPADTILRGRRLEEVLGVTPLKLQSVVNSIKEGDSSVKQPKMEIKCSGGFAADGKVSAF